MNLCQIKKGDVFRIVACKGVYTAAADAVGGQNRDVCKVRITTEPHMITGLGHLQVEIVR